MPTTAVVQSSSITTVMESFVNGNHALNQAAAVIMGPTRHYDHGADRRPAVFQVDTLLAFTAVGVFMEMLPKRQGEKPGLALVGLSVYG
ncbi:MAG: hypothetical protein ACLS4Z_11030 [Christensenellaceae bacterium]